MDERTRVIRARFGIAALAAGLVTALSAVPVTAAVTPVGTLTAQSVTITVQDVFPNTPPASHTKQPLTIVLSLHNNFHRTLPVEVAADRGDPITGQSGLDTTMARPKAPSPDLVAHIKTARKRVTLLPASDADVVFRTTTDIPEDAGLCLCHDAIYPLYFTATYVSGQTRTVVGATQTYLPVFGKTTPKPVLVSWVWPLLDRPHRLREPASGIANFLDDDLAGEVAPGGRLDKMLQVVEGVAGKARLTLMLDPEIIDELAVMSGGSYRVPSGDGGTVAGAGASVAIAWLQRLRTVLLRHPDIQPAFTAPADPDVESLSERGLTWQAVVRSPVALVRVSAALGTQLPSHDISWPIGETLSTQTAARLVRQGSRIVIVNDATLPGGGTRTGPSNALSPVRTGAGAARAAVTSASIQPWVTRVLEPGGPGLGALPELVSQVAIRAVESLHQSHFVLITPPRYLDPQPATAVRAILATTKGTGWSRSVSLRAASTGVTPVDRGLLQRQRDAPGLPAATVGAIAYVRRTLAGMTSMLSASDAARLLGPLPAAVQRTASSGLVGHSRLSIAESQALVTQIRGLLAGVSLVEPANGTYTVTANDSSVPVTIKNSNAVAVRVRVRAHAANGLPGFTADRIAVRQIPAGSSEQVNLPTHVARTGRIEVAVQLSTPRGLPLGAPLPLTLRSTALGTIGVVITTAAGIVLFVALLLRAIGYVRRRNQPREHPRVPDDIAAS